MVVNSKTIISLLGVTLLFQACNSPDKKAVKGDSVVDAGGGMDVKRDTGFNKLKKDVPDNTNPGNNRQDYTNESNVDSDAAAFMKNAAIASMIEIDLGELALQSANPDIRKFAAMMVKDHIDANKELRALAYESEILLPISYYPDQKEHINKIENLTGFNFDKQYIAMMVDEHSKTIALFNSGADTKEKDVRKFALKMLPVLDRHYSRAKSIMATFK